MNYKSKAALKICVPTCVRLRTTGERVYICIISVREKAAVMLCNNIEGSQGDMYFGGSVLDRQKIIGMRIYSRY